MKPTPISGFPEWLPPQRMIEQYVLGRIRGTFELYGFAPLETRAFDRGTWRAQYGAGFPVGIAEALGGVPIPPIRIQVNNRKVCEGFYRGVGVPDPEAALRAVDKLAKIGPARVAALLAETAGATE